MDKTTATDARSRGSFGEARAASGVARPVFGERSGLSLLELMLAFALFAVIIAVGMQAYVSAYTGTIVQEQRTQAVQLARSVISNLREIRDDSAATFPDSLIARYPADVAVTDVRSPADSALEGQETIFVEYGDTTENPLAVRVTVEWRDPRNRPMILDVTTLLTDR